MDSHSFAWIRIHHFLTLLDLDYEAFVQSHIPIQPWLKLSLFFLIILVTRVLYPLGAVCFSSGHFTEVMERTMVEFLHSGDPDVMVSVLTCYAIWVKAMCIGTVHKDGSG